MNELTPSIPNKRKKIIQTSVKLTIYWIDAISALIDIFKASFLAINLKGFNILRSLSILILDRSDAYVK